MEKIKIRDLINGNYTRLIDSPRLMIEELIEKNYPRNAVKGKIKIADLIPKNLPQEKIPREPPTELLCDNPSCRQPIKTEKIAYSKYYKEIYHPGDCSIYAIAVKTFNSHKIIYENISYITREEAFRIKSGLEKKAE